MRSSAWECREQSGSGLSESTPAHWGDPEPDGFGRREYAASEQNQVKT